MNLARTTSVTFLLCAIAACQRPTSAGAPAEKPSQPALAAGEFTVSKSEWLASMSTVLPAAMCGDSQYFRQCFEVSEDRCLEVMRLSTKTCLSQHEKELPDVLVQPREGTRWGQVVGNCVGNSYELTLVSQRKSSVAKCNDVSAWVAAAASK